MNGDISSSNEIDCLGGLLYNDLEKDNEEYIEEHQSPTDDDDNDKQENDDYIEKHHILEEDDNEQGVDINSSTVPRVGMEFPSDDVAFEFYIQLALEQGLGVRKFSSYKSRKGDLLLRRSFVCCKEDFNKENRPQNEREIKRRRAARIGCKARMDIERNSEGVCSEKF